MKNLKLAYKQTHAFVDLCNVKNFCFDGSTLYLYGSKKVYKVIDVAIRQAHLYANLEEVLDSEVSDAVSFDFHVEKNILVLSVTTGDIVSIDLNPSQGKEVFEVVGCVEGGILAAEWSPEQEFLVLVTGGLNVVLMTNEFDPLTEVPLHTDEFGENQFITVGWGKKETQFHGSIGKAAAKSSSNTSSAVSDTNFSIHISWRGDGEYFAISTRKPDANFRYLRIYNREGTLQYTSEESPGLECAFHWQPSGALMATTQRFVNKHVVSFFEKNGLKHGEFNLPFSPNQVDIIKLMWSGDSKVMLIWSEEKETNTESSEDNENGGSKCKKVNNRKRCIQFFAIGNYHWYLKYTIEFIEEDILAVTWDKKDHNVLQVLTRKKNCTYFYKYFWLWAVDHSKGMATENKAVVSVIDGTKLLTTCFCQGIIPPPMCTFTINAPLSINSVTFAPSQDEYFNNDQSAKESQMSLCDLFIQLCDGSLLFYTSVKKAAQNEYVEYKQIKQFKVILSEEEEATVKTLNNFVWFKQNIILCLLESNSVKPGSNIYLCKIVIDNFDNDELTVHRLDLLKFVPTFLIPYPDSTDRVLAQGTDGKMYSINFHNCSHDLKVEEISIYSKTDTKQFASIQIGKLEDNRYIIFAVDFANRFYINGKQVANNVTSFTVHDKHLLITTLQHKLFCINLDANITKTFENKTLSDVSSRRVERGSRIVIAIPEDTRVILQMPRGNLECIHPRALSLCKIGDYLDSHKYYEAFDIMRKQRINLNLIYDHNPKLFLDHIEDFVDNIKNPSWISLFLSELNDEDVTKTMYSAIYGTKSFGLLQPLNGSTKVHLICNFVNQYLVSRRDAESYILPILTSYIKKGRIEDIEMALLKVKELREREINAEKNVISADEAMHYILYLIDVEELYKIALGLYDFDLVLFVASKSQKDPKEYIPFLNSLRKLETNYQKYTIDKHLKRNDKALKHILNCEGDDKSAECFNFIKQQKLYKTALNLLTSSTDRYKQIAFFYGEELFTNHVYTEAGMMFCRAGSFEKALVAFRRNNDWREIISCIKHLQYTEDEVNELYKSVATSLNETKQYSEAAVVYVEYLQDITSGIGSLCHGKLWGEAYRIVELHSRTDLIENVIKPGVIGHYHSLMLQIESMRDVFKKHKDRLFVVRTEKAQQKNILDENIIDDEHDMYSDISTVRTASNVGSRTSARSYRSSKNKRKHERKLLSLKEGSAFEDMALVASLHQTMSSCLALKSEVKELNRMLLKLEKDEAGRKLQELFSKTLKEMEDGKTEIWNESLLTGHSTFGPDATSNMIADMHQKGGRDVIVGGLEPHLKISPIIMNSPKWELETFK